MSGEEDFLESLKTLTGNEKSHLGDDCAILESKFDPALLVTVDSLVESVHYPTKASLDQIAVRLTRVNLSDVAAMGGVPKWSLLAEGSREPLSERETFVRNLTQELTRFDVELIGGDVSSLSKTGSRFHSLVVIGRAHSEGTLQRSEAQPGDRIAVTGPLGGSAAALGRLENGTNSHREQSVFYYPPVKLETGEKLVKNGVSGALDVSDGLLKDLLRFCRASSVGAKINWELIPVHPLAREFGTETQALEWAITGGEDYELLFALPRATSLDSSPNHTIIGEFTKDKELVWEPPLPESINLETEGYDHFKFCK